MEVYHLFDRMYRQLRQLRFYLQTRVETRPMTDLTGWTCPRNSATYRLCIFRSSTSPYFAWKGQAGPLAPADHGTESHIRMFVSLLLPL